MTLIQSPAEQTMEVSRQPSHSLEIATHNVERSLANDNSAPSLLEVMNVNQQTGPTASGLTDHDYPTLTGLPLSINNMTQIKTLNKVPLPPEIMEHFSQISRAWLTIDSDIYVWAYEDGSDVAYYDGLNETIISVGLVEPKEGIFHSFIKYLLVLTTAVDIVVLGVTFTPGPNGPLEEIHLVPDPVFSMPTDGCVMTIIAGTSTGRIFLGSKNGCLYELAYQAESSWFGKRCKKINHSTSALSFLVPSFLNAALNEEDGIIQISIDNSRHILYVLTEKGSIEVYDMGEKGNSFSKIVKHSQTSLVQQAKDAVKTLDSQNFRPIVSISAVESYESPYINLVAVTQTGVRFYFTVVGFGNLNPNQRPYTLTLLHVRLPPGYSASMTTRPRMVHMATYKEGNLILLSTVNETDVLWCISSDVFPFTPAFMEAYTTITLDGPAWALAEVRTRVIDVKSLHPHHQDPPLVVRQHLEPPRKYIVLTAQGAHIFMKLRPVDLLRQLLFENRGPENDIVRSFFIIQKEDQACATSLILACLESVQNSEVAEWATRAFFIYGGEPKVAPPLPQQLSPNRTSTFMQTSFMPEIISTPRSDMFPQVHPQSMQSTGISPFTTHNQTTMLPMQGITTTIFSARHNGLYLYLSRILRPVWYRNCVKKLDVTNGKSYLTSALPVEECVIIVSHLNALRSFLKKNTQLSVVLSSGIDRTANQSASFTGTPQKLTVSKLNHTIQDAQIDERNSLTAFKAFVNHSCQVLGLWRILCEHQFHILIDKISEMQKQMLQTFCFKDLLLYGEELHMALINSLINSYLGDNASVDSISAKLRDICPDLYKNEDAACTKANEILKNAKTKQNKDEKEEMLVTALNLCKSVAPNINLHEVCQQFLSLGAYNAILELCVDCARKIDPDNLGKHYYKTGEQKGEQEGYQFYAKRMAIYKEILYMIEHLHHQSSSGNQEASQILPETSSMVRQIISEALGYKDELLQIAIYEWMITKKLTSDLIKIGYPSLEAYLIRAAERNSENIVVQDILWKFYESSGNHAAAAKILNELASKPGPSLTLKDRLAYIARAVMCMRSDTVGYAPHLGVFLRELEDKMEVAKVQEQVLEAVSNLRGIHPGADEAVTALNSGLYDLTQMYEDFCDPFDLWECKLAIIECSGYSDVTLIEMIWHNILQVEVTKCFGLPEERMDQVLNKVKHLFDTYRQSSVCFPLPYIIDQLELLSAKLKADVNLVPSTLISYSIPLDTLISVYTRMLNTAVADRFWSIEENFFRLCKVFAVSVTLFLRSHESFGSVAKRKIISLCQDTISGLLTNLYSKVNTDELVVTLRSLQSALSRL